jgi:hypothetical protein
LIPPLVNDCSAGFAVPGPTDHRALSGHAEQIWAQLTGLTLGYGYQPWQAPVARQLQERPASVRADLEALATRVTRPPRISLLVAVEVRRRRMAAGGDGRASTYSGKRTLNFAVDGSRDLGKRRSAQRFPAVC